jgi:hypothetical protein
MILAHLTLIAAGVVATAGAALADEHDRMVRICLDRMREATGYPESSVTITQEHWTETGHLNLTLRTTRKVAHCTVRPDLVIAGFDLMN